MLYIKVCPHSSNDHWMFECDRFIHEDIRDKDRPQAESSDTYRIRNPETPTTTLNINQIFWYFTP